MWLVALLACVVSTLPERNCATRVAFYPDADGDGLGEPTDVYFGCEAPEGWTSALETAVGGDTGAPAHTGVPGGTGDTAAPGHSGDTLSEVHTGAAGAGDTSAPVHTGLGGGHSGAATHSGGGSTGP